MKKIALCMLLAGFAFQAQAAAGALCDGASTATGKDVTPDSKFIKTAFKMNCSANVLSQYGEDNATAWTATASKKGACYIIGNTNGGAPKQATSTCSPGSPDFTSAADPTPASKLSDAQALGSS